MTIRTCANPECAKEFVSVQPKHQVCCSAKCRARSYAYRVDPRPCDHCGKPTRNPKFCDRSCAAKFHNALKPKRQRTSPRVACLHCGTERQYGGRLVQCRCAGAWGERMLREDCPKPGKEQLYRYGLKTEECEWCGLGPEWNGKPIVLELDHVNGNPRDNRLENLRILCPNCHSQTDTHCGKNTAAQKLKRVA